MLSGTSRVHTAGLLCRSPSALLSAPSSSPLLCGLRCLLSAHSIFATSSHSSASWLEQSEGPMEERIGKEMQRLLSSWGTSHESRHKAHCGMQRILFTSCPSSELQSEGYTHMCFPQPPTGPETIRKSGFRQRPSDQTRLGHF